MLIKKLRKIYKTPKKKKGWNGVVIIIITNNLGAIAKQLSLMHTIYIYIRPKKTRFQCQCYGSNANSSLLRLKWRRIPWFLSSSHESKFPILCSPKNMPFLLVRAPTTRNEERKNNSLERNKKQEEQKDKYL